MKKSELRQIIKEEIENMDWKRTNEIPKSPPGVKNFTTMIDYLVKQGKITNEEAKLLSVYSEDDGPNYEKYKNWK